MPNSPTKEDELEQRRHEVWKLRVRGKSIRTIAQMLGMSPTRVHADLEAERKEIADETKQAALKHREIELARLDSWIETATTQLEAIPDFKTYLDGWDFKLQGMPPKLEQLAPILQALAKLSERRSKLLGLDAPVRTELTLEKELDSIIELAEKVLEPGQFAKLVEALSAPTGGTQEAAADPEGKEPS